MAKFIRYAFPPLFGSFQTSYEISNTEIGLLYTSLLTIYSILQFPSGVIADRIGSVQVIIIRAILTGIGSLIVAINSSVIILAVGMTIIDVGTGVHKKVIIGLLSRTCKNNTGRIFDIFDTIGSYGGVGAPTIATLFLVAPDPISMVLSNILGANWRGFLLSGFIINAESFETERNLV